MPTVKFYRDEEKQHQVYPDIDPDGIFPGVTVGLANNLTSPDGLSDTAKWHWRTAGGEQDISDGYADLTTLKGASESSTIEESIHVNVLASGVRQATVTKDTFKTQKSETGTYNFTYTPKVTYSSEYVYSLDNNQFARQTRQQTNTYTFRYQAIVGQGEGSETYINELNSSTFVEKVNEEPNTYTFKHEGEQWKLNDNVVNLAEYGITLNEVEIPEGTEITIIYSSNSWYRDQSIVSLQNYGIQTTGTEKVGAEIEINYESNDWCLEGEIIDLNNYGISITDGSPTVEDIIQIVYIKEEVGVVKVANPTAIYTIGLNQFNRDGESKLIGYTIATTGKIEEKSGETLIWFRCLGGNTYTIYNSTASSTTRVGYSATEPNNNSTVTVLSPVSSATSGQSVQTDSNKYYVTPEQNGYLCVSTTDYENICCHLTWSGYNDEVFETYWDSAFTLPTTDNEGKPLSEYGMANVGGDYYDEMDFDRFVYHKRTERIEYTEENYQNVQSKGVPYIYDNTWIYYGIDTVDYTLSQISPAYRVSDFGTEEIIGTELDMEVTTFYQQNLKDKLRRSVEILDNKTQTINASSTTDQYPSAKAVYDLEYDVWKMLGLHVDTFSTTKTYAVGAYVVRNHKLYKCKTAVTSAGAWKDANWEESYLFKAS